MQQIVRKLTIFAIGQRSSVARRSVPALLATGLGVALTLGAGSAVAVAQQWQPTADIAATAGVGFTINHIAAVIIPAAFGFLWLVSPAAVFLAGAAMALCSLLLAFNVPTRPEPGNEVVVGRTAAQPVAAE